MTLGPSGVSTSPTYSSPENGVPRPRISASTGDTTEDITEGTNDGGAHGSGAYAPMPPVFGPVSPSPIRLKSCAGSSGTAVTPSVTTNSDTSGPDRYSSTTTPEPVAACARATARS